MRHHASILAAVLPALLLTACRRPPATVGAGERLVVIGAHGEIATVAPDGSHAAALTTPADKRYAFQQPAWSPDGSRLAWVEVHTRRASVESTLVIAPRDGGLPLRTRTESAPFYLSWSPDGGSVAYLASAQVPSGDGRLRPSMALGLVRVAEPYRPRQVASGSPFYFAWAPDSSRLLLHTNGGRLHLHDVAASSDQPELGTPGSFNAPGWERAGNRLVYALADGDAQRLVVAAPGAGAPRELLRHHGPSAFVVNPRLPQVAVSAGARPGPLAVADYSGAQVRLTGVTDLPVIAFFWSPDGRQLLFLAPDAADPTPRVRNIQLSAPVPYLRWWVWQHGREPRALGKFLPHPVFAGQYLQFFDQYAQSMTLWSPDSTRFCYAGRDDQGQEGVFVQPLDGAPKRIAAGAYAAWAPQAP